MRNLRSYCYWRRVRLYASLLEYASTLNFLCIRFATLVAWLSMIAGSAKLEGCILGKNTKVGAKAELVKCVTQAGYEVNAGGEFARSLRKLGTEISTIENYKNEKLELSDWTAAPVDEDSTSASEDETSEDD